MMLPALTSTSEAVPGTIVAVPLPAKSLSQTSVISGDGVFSVDSQRNSTQQKGPMTESLSSAASSSSQSTAATTAAANSPPSSFTSKNDEEEGWTTVHSTKSIKAAQRSQKVQAAKAALPPPTAQIHRPAQPTRPRPTSASASSSFFPNNNNNPKKIRGDRKTQQQQGKAKGQEHGHGQDKGQDKPRVRLVIVFDANNKLSWGEELIEADAAETAKERDAGWKKIKVGSASSGSAGAGEKVGRVGGKGDEKKKKRKEGIESMTDNRKAERETVVMREMDVKKSEADASLGNNRFDTLILLEDRG